MRDALAKQDRDILFSFCQYGMGDVWQWGEQFGGNCWRTTGDINDSWGSMAGIGFKQSGPRPLRRAGPLERPGHAGGRQGRLGPQAAPDAQLTPNEQYTHISLWSLLSAPLLIGCDMTQLDPFTFGLLSNDEVIAVNQDPLGKQASRVWHLARSRIEAWAKPLADGSGRRWPVQPRRGAGRPASPCTGPTCTSAAAADQARDLWRQKDLAAAARRPHPDDPPPRVRAVEADGGRALSPAGAMPDLLPPSRFGRRPVACGPCS